MSTKYNLRFRQWDWQYCSKRWYCTASDCALPVFILRWRVVMVLLASNSSRICCWFNIRTFSLFEESIRTFAPFTCLFLELLSITVANVWLTPLRKMFWFSAVAIIERRSKETRARCIFTGQESGRGDGESSLGPSSGDCQSNAPRSGEWEIGP